MPGLTPQATANAFAVLMMPADIMSSVSPILALVCATAAAALPCSCNRWSAAIPALSLPMPASLKMAARALAASTR